MASLKTPALFNKPDTGLLLVRLIVGGFMIAHGVSKLLGGTEAFKQVGATMALVGVDFAPVFWGFMAAFTETVCGALVAVGFLFRISCALLLWVMIVATIMHVNMDSSFLSVTSHPIKIGAIFLGLLFIGPGRFSVQGSGEGGN